MYVLRRAEKKLENDKGETWSILVENGLRERHGKTKFKLNIVLGLRRIRKDSISNKSLWIHSSVSSSRRLATSPIASGKK